MKLLYCTPIHFGRAEWNQGGRFGDQMAILRCSASIHQREKLGKHLASVPFDAAFTE